MINHQDEGIGFTYTLLSNESLECLLFLPQAAEISLLLDRVNIHQKVHTNSQSRV